MEISARGYNRYTVHKYREISAGAGGYNRYTIHQYMEISAGGYNSYTVHQYKYTPLLCFSLKMQLTLYSIQYSNLSE